jgi:hypothetical protein
MTTWTLDTCGCEVTVSDPDFKYVGMYRKCPMHAHLNDNDAWAQIYGDNIDGENPVKTFARANLSRTSKLKEDEIPFYFDHTRKLHLVIPEEAEAGAGGGTGPSAAAAQTFIRKEDKSKFQEELDKDPKLKNKVVID